MRQSRLVGIVVGLFFCVGVAAVFLLTMRVSNISSYQTENGYTVSALFENIGGLKTGASVDMAGVRVGRVTDIELDRKTFQARVKMTISPRFNDIPEDSDASILTAGLLGEQYIGLGPGGSPDPLKQGSVIEFTQSALVLERLIGQLVFSISGDKDDKPAAGSGKQATADDEDVPNAKSIFE